MTIFDGDVYVARAETGHYKIGISKTPKKRIKHFKTIMPIDVELVHSFPSDNCREAEKQLHSWFDKFHHKGEWYDIPEDALNHFIFGMTAYFEGRFHWKMSPEQKLLFELERDNVIAYIEAELPY